LPTLPYRKARKNQSLRVLHVAAEVFPFIKTGGLADVAAALPQALTKSGCDVQLLLPGLPPILEALQSPRKLAEFGAVFGAGSVRLLRGTLPGLDVGVVVIDSPWLYGRGGGPYLDDHGMEWSDNLQRFALLGWTAAHLASGEFGGRWLPDVVHAHDWHAALACCYLKAHPGSRARSVFTVHNLAYQGIFPSQDFPLLGLPQHFIRPYGELEFHGELSFMKGGLTSATRITTVSPSYAREITTAEFGCNLEGVVSLRAEALSGILNGIDTRIWDPAIDQALTSKYSLNDLSGKRECKLALQREFGLDTQADAPLVGVVSRLSSQKGLDLLCDALPQALQSGMQLVLLGSGEQSLQDAFLAAAAANPRQIGIKIGYDEQLAHRIIAGSDVIAVPSRFEPCGLTQLYGMRYGTLPLVRRVGGLADTVDAEVGFSFLEPESSLADALETMIDTYRNAPGRWQAMRRCGMQRDFSWSEAARRYSELYRQIVDD
jgi:starch synthase